MKLQLDFVDRNETYKNNHIGYGDQHGPLQLIRPMPDQLRNYITTQDYEDFCIQKIDPLLEELYEAETSPIRFRYSYVHFIMAVLLLVGFCLVIMTIIDENMKKYNGIACFICVILLVVTSHVKNRLEACQFPERKLHDAIREECRHMSYRCDAYSRAMNPNQCHIYWFELALQRGQSLLDYRKMTVSHITVSVANKNHMNDNDNNSSSDHYYHITER